MGFYFVGLCGILLVFCLRPARPARPAVRLSSLSSINCQTDLAQFANKLQVKHNKRTIKALENGQDSVRGESKEKQGKLGQYLT